MRIARTRPEPIDISRMESQGKAALERSAPVTRASTSRVRGPVMTSVPHRAVRSSIPTDPSAGSPCRSRSSSCHSAAAEWHDDDLLRHGLPADGSVGIEDLTARWGTLVITGPRTREVLARVTGADLSNAAFPWLSMREMSIGSGRVRAIRMSYVGELGWELHAPMALLPELYDTLSAAGAPLGLRDFGIYAVESLRLDKCYRGWKGDLEIGFTPYEASLDRFVDLSKPDFVGRAAVLEERKRGPARRLVPLLLETAGDADAPFCASVYRGDEIVGIVTSGGWSHTLERSVALAYLRADLAAPGSRVQIDVLGERRWAVVGQEPLYDPQNQRLRA